MCSGLHKKMIKSKLTCAFFTKIFLLCILIFISGNLKKKFRCGSIYNIIKTPKCVLTLCLCYVSSGSFSLIHNFFNFEIQKAKKILKKIKLYFLSLWLGIQFVMLRYAQILTLILTPGYCLD